MNSLWPHNVRILIVLPLLLGFSLTTGAGSAAVAQAPAQVVPDCDPAQRTCNTYEFGGDWVVDPSANVTGPGTGFFAVTNQALANTSFMYSEFPWAPNHVPDNQSSVEQTASAILTQIGFPSLAPVATGTLADGTLWNLYAVPFGGVTFGMLFAADTDDPSQNDVDMQLTSPAGTFDQALTAVQTDIRVNGSSPLAGIDPAQAMAALAGTAPVTPAVGITPTLGVAPTTVPPIFPTPDTLQTPAAPNAQLDQTVAVGTDTVAYNSGEWQYDPANSSGMIAAFQNVLDPRLNFVHAQARDRMSGGDAQLAVQLFDPPTSFAAQNAQQLASAVLPSGHAYVLYRWNRAGADEVVLFVVDVTTTPGTGVIQALFAPPDQFGPGLDSVKQFFQVNGVAPFSDLDPAALVPLISGTTAVTPTTGPTPPAGPTPSAFPRPPARPPFGGTSTPAVVTTPTPAAVVMSTPTVGIASQSLTVAGATITYSAGWVLDTANSVTDSVAYFDAADGSGSWFGYRPVQPTAGDAAIELGTLTTGFLQNIGATEVQQLTLVPLSSTSAWALTTAKLSGVPIVVLIFADTATAGQVRIQMLFSTEPAALAATLTNAQAGIQIDSVGTFTGVDPAAVAALLGSGAVTTPVPGTTPASGGAGTDVAQYTSDRYGYTLTYDPAVWQITPDDDPSDAEEWVTLDSDTSTVNIAGRPDTTGGDLTRCVNVYLVDHGWDDGAWEATPIESLLVEPGRVAGSFALSDQIFGVGTAYMYVECRDIGSGNTLLITQFVYTDEGETVPSAEVADFEQLMAGLQVSAPAGTTGRDEELLAGMTVSGG